MAAYREAMAEFAQMRTWTSGMPTCLRRTDEGGPRQAAGIAQAAKGNQGKKKAKEAKKAARRAEKNMQKARTRDSLQALSKLGETGRRPYRIVSRPPILIPARDLAATYGLSADDLAQVIRDTVPRLPGHPAT